MDRKIFVWLLLVSAMFQCAWSRVPLLSWKLVDSVPHMPSHFTQGLVYNGNGWFESTGLYGSSGVYRLGSRGEVLDSVRLPEEVFGEGMECWNGRILVLTWREGRLLVLDSANLRLLGEVPWIGEGWGLAWHKGTLLASDGSSTLRRVDPSSGASYPWKDVRAEGKPLESLNELESTGSWLLANVWQTDRIAVVGPDGRVVGWIDLSSLVGRVRANHPGVDVLNGIAWDASHRRLWITGKLWPRMYAIQVEWPRQ